MEMFFLQNYPSPHPSPSRGEGVTEFFSNFVVDKLKGTLSPTRERDGVRGHS